MGYDSIEIEMHSCERQYERKHAKSNHIRLSFDYGRELVMETDFYISKKYSYHLMQFQIRILNRIILYQWVLGMYVKIQTK